MDEAMGWENVAAETAFLTFPDSFWLVLTGGVNKLLTEVTGDKGCGLPLLTFDKGVIVLWKTVLGSWLETVPAELTRTDAKEEFTLAVCGRDEQCCSGPFCSSASISFATVFPSLC